MRVCHADWYDTIYYYAQENTNSSNYVSNKKLTIFANNLVKNESSYTYDIQQSHCNPEIISNITLTYLT